MGGGIISQLWHYYVEMCKIRAITAHLLQVHIIFAWQCMYCKRIEELGDLDSRLHILPCVS